MLITFTKPLNRPDSLVRAAARKAGCYVKVSKYKKWNGSSSISFTLVETFHDGALSASVDQHDQVIEMLLTLDPQAKVKTARAIYEGLADFQSQKKGRVA